MFLLFVSTRDPFWVSFLQVLLVVVLCPFLVLSSDNQATSIQLENTCGVEVMIHWISPSTGKATEMFTMGNGKSTGMNSFTGHKFQVTELPSSSSGVCQSEDKVCKVSYFTVSKSPEEFLQIKTGLVIAEAVDPNKVESPALAPPELLSLCSTNAKLALESSPDHEDRILKDYEACVSEGLAHTLIQATNAKAFETDLRDDISRYMENFTCNDPDLDTTPDVDEREWVSEKDGVSRTVHVKLDRPASRIHVIENFASTEECDAMEEVAQPKLHRATTADGKGGSMLNPNRKALQAGIRPKFEKEAEGDLVARLSRRVYDYTNYELGLNLTEHGQEPLMSIQYFGRNTTDTEPDRYTPHCDGTCKGKPHPFGARMATMVIYCTVPERGGHTNFQNAGVHVKPQVGSAIFFSYIDPATNLTDTGLTQHSGCPVYSGEKKIITQWVRYGVSKEITHNHFDTNNVLATDGAH